MIVLKDAEYSLPFIDNPNDLKDNTDNMAPVFCYCNDERVNKILVQGVDEHYIDMLIFFNSYKINFLYIAAKKFQIFDLMFDSPTIGQSILRDSSITSIAIIKNNSIQGATVKLRIYYEYFENHK